MARKSTAKSALGRALDAAAAKALHRGKLEAPKNPSAPPRGLVSPKDERGVPYPGDWPNPLGDKNRGCF
jgi:hypothetical protein